MGQPQCGAVKSVGLDGAHRCERFAVTGSAGGYCVMHGGLDDTTTPDEVRRKPEQPRKRCNRTKRNGEQCKNFAAPGTTICRKHGANATHIQQRAKQRLLEAVDPLMAELVHIGLDRKKSDADRLRAITWALERAGFSTKTEIAVTLKPWEEIVDVDGILVDMPAIEDATEASTLVSGVDAEDYETQAREREAQLAIESEATLPDAQIVPMPQPSSRRNASEPPAHVMAGLRRAQG